MIAKPNDKRYKINHAEVRALYSTGLSSRKIATLLQISKSQVFKICTDIKRTKSEALRNNWKKESTHWRTLRNRARKLVETSLNRKLDKSEVVHHIDHDPINNILENLQVMSTRDHGLHHHPANLVPRHKRLERIAYQKIYSKEYWKTYVRKTS